MIDSHSHIYTERYQEDRDAVIARAAAVGVTQLLRSGVTWKNPVP
jgi:Tat protein secretion system quality control protein TatD with DNase activity